jgi:prepilin-type N-terminal cleavage/methylation domain-containing protein
MPRTLPPNPRAVSPRNKARGYTLIEMIVVVTILALVAAMVMPSLASMKATSDRRDMMSGIRRIAADARERAIRSSITTQIVYDEGAKELQIQEAQSDGTTTTLVRQPMTSGVEPQRFQLAGRDSTPTDFKLTFSSDGHSNGGGLEFKDFSIYVDQNGGYQFIDGPLPDPTQQNWGAGDLEQRMQTQ